MVDSFPSVSRIILEYWMSIASILVFFLPGVTYLISTALALWSINQAGNGKKPPTIPYWIPYLGNLIPFVKDTAGFLEKVSSTYTPSPVRFKLGPEQGYLLTSHAHVSALLRASGRLLSPKPGIAMTMTNMFGTPPSLSPLYRNDNSGISPAPLPGSKVKPENRVFYHQHAAAHSHLSGVSLNAMTERFMNFLSADLQLESAKSEYRDWVHLDDLYTFAQSAIFRAAVGALFGTHLLRLNPGFEKDFWAYVDATPTLLKGLPRWMAPKAYQSRDKVLKALEKWHRFAREKEDWRGSEREGEPEWGEYWGSKYLKKRQEFGEKMDGMSAEGLAAEDLALMVAANANAIVCAAWLLIFTHADTRLPPIVLETLRPYLQLQSSTPPSSSPSTISSNTPSPPPSSTPPQPSFPITPLTTDPLLQSLYAETLRLRVALLLNRTPTSGPWTLDSWKFPRGRMICLSTLAAGKNRDVWSESEGGKWSVEGFWAGRFLVGHGKDGVGSLEKESVGRKGEGGGEEGMDIPAPEKRVFSLDGLAGSWIPYGGGPFMCPGRHFAKQEIIGSFALFVSHFEIELEGGGNGKGGNLEPDMRFFGLGALPPKNKIGARIRKRRGGL